MLFISKQKKIESQLADYRQSIRDCVNLFVEAVERYGRDADRVTLQIASKRVSKAESLADDIRREIEVMMYSKSLFPESRGDILGLLETMDRIPNQAESTVQALLNQHMTIPSEYYDVILQLVHVCRRCVEAMLDASEKLFVDFTNATVAVGKIDELESQADNIEADLIERVFASNINGFEKILLQGFIKHISGISDRAENVGDRIRVTVAKRSI